MRMEREDDRPSVPACGHDPKAFEQRTVADVHGVEVAYRNHRTARPAGEFIDPRTDVHHGGA